MKTVKDIVNDAVREYNRTIFGSNYEFHQRDTYLERRGIFYNCLRRQFQYGMSSYNFSNAISVQNLSCIFREDGSIEKFSIDKSPSWSSSHDDVKILNELKAIQSLQYLDTEARISFDSIKNFQFKT